MKIKNDDVNKIEVAGRTELLAPIQLFTCDIPDGSDLEVNKAKKLMYSMASEMGFTNHQDWKLQRYTDGGLIKWRLEANFTV